MIRLAKPTIFAGWRTAFDADLPDGGSSSTPPPPPSTKILQISFAKKYPFPDIMDFQMTKLSVV